MAFAIDRHENDQANGRALPPKRHLLFGLNVDGLTMAQTVDRCRHAIATRQSLLVGVLNAAKIVNMRRDPALRDALLDCDVLLADGQSIVWASRLLGKPLPERVAGIDLFEELLALAHSHGRNVYLLGAKPEVLAALEQTVESRWPGLTIAGSHHGYFNDVEAEAIAADIGASQSDMLFLGMASPKKEIFLRRFQSALNVPVLHGVGGSFDVMAGLTKRAPPAWQRLGLEWAYRLLQEPGRMWKRYLTTNSAFIALTLREAVRPSAAYQPSSSQDSASQNA